MAVVALLVVGVVGGAFVLRGDVGSAPCTGSVTLAVRTSPSLTGALTEAATAYQQTAPAVDGNCVSIRVDTTSGRQVADFMKEGWSDSTGGDIPDVWVPDSATWLTLARTTEPARRLLAGTATVIATSPVVIAMPRTMAEDLDWPRRQLSWADLRAREGDKGFWSARGRPDRGGFAVGLPDPRASAAGLSALVNVIASAVGTPVAQLTEEMFVDDLATRGAVLGVERKAALVADDDTALLAAFRGAGDQAGDGAGAARLSAFPISESLVYQFNRGVGIGAPAEGRPADRPARDDPEAQLAASYPTDGLVVDEILYTILSRAADDPVKAQVARDFLATLQSGPGLRALAANGFRPPDRTTDSFTPEVGLIAQLRAEPHRPLDAAVLVAVQATFAGIHQRGNTLAVFDTSGSMDEEVPDSGGRSRLSVALDAAKSAVPLFADDSDLGLWHFSTRLQGDRDWVELVPLGPMGELVGGVPRADALLHALDGIEPRGDTGLHDTALAAFRYLSQNYMPGRPNQVVLLTDGKNSDPGSMSLDELVQTLRREYSPQRPVQIITVGYGVDTDPEALWRISEATGGRTYPALDPNTIFQVLVNALTEIPG